MNRDDLSNNLETLSWYTNIASVAMFGLLAVTAVIFGVFMFIRMGSDERDMEAKLQNIQAGEVQPETLTAVRKYINPSRHGGGYPHVIFRSQRQPEINYSATQELYDAVSPGSAVTGYYFPDGFFIPLYHGEGAGIGKWIFLASGLSTGAALAVVALWKLRIRVNIA